MSTLKFAETHNLVAFLEKLEESNGFAEIIDFLNTIFVQYALTVSPTIYTTCIEQFWTSAKAKTVNEERQIQALVDKKKVIITETSIRSDLKLDDAEGTDCLPTATIFAELERMGGMSKHKGIYVIPSQTKKVFANMKRPGKGFSRKITPLFITIMVQATEDMGEDSGAPTDSHFTPIHTQPSLSKPQKKKSRKKQRKDSGPTEPIIDEAINKEHVATPSCDPPQSEMQSKQERKIVYLDANAEVTLVDETQEMNDENLVLEEQEKEVTEKEVSVVDPVTTVGEVVTTAGETLIEIKAAKPKAVTSSATITTTTRPKARGVVVQEPSEFKTTSSPLQASQLLQAKDKGKAKMVEPEKSLKKKDDITMDEEVSRNLEA
ncbi:hypothetical protein Tco_0122897 [Tanacetum coccineum]